MFPKRIKCEREKLGLNKSQMAEKLNLNYQTYNNYETGKRKPNIEIIKKIANDLNVSIDYLTTDESSEWIDKNIVPFGKTCMIPVVGQVCAGNGMLAVENIIAYEAADIKYANGDYYYLIVSGDSMYPKIEEGDMVLIKKQNSVDSGNLGIFIIDEEDGVIKKVKYDNDYIELISFNPMYPLMRFEGEDVMRVRVVGKVVESKKKW